MLGFCWGCCLPVQTPHQARPTTSVLLPAPSHGHRKFSGDVCVIDSTSQSACPGAVGMSAALMWQVSAGEGWTQWVRNLCRTSQSLDYTTVAGGLEGCSTRSIFQTDFSTERVRFPTEGLALRQRRSVSIRVQQVEAPSLGLPFLPASRSSAVRWRWWSLPWRRCKVAVRWPLCGPGTRGSVNVHFSSPSCLFWWRLPI